MSPLFTTVRILHIQLSEKVFQMCYYKQYKFTFVHTVCSPLFEYCTFSCRKRCFKCVIINNISSHLCILYCTYLLNNIPKKCVRLLFTYIINRYTYKHVYIIIGIVSLVKKLWWARILDKCSNNILVSMLINWEWTPSDSESSVTFRSIFLVIRRGPPPPPRPNL